MPLRILQFEIPATNEVLQTLAMLDVEQVRVAGDCEVRSVHQKFMSQ